MTGTIDTELLLFKYNYYRIVLSYITLFYRIALSYITLFSKYVPSPTSIKDMIPFARQ